MLQRYQVGALVTQGTSHRTVLVPFTYGSSGGQVINPTPGRLTTSIYPRGRHNCFPVTTIALRFFAQASPNEYRPFAPNFFGDIALCALAEWLNFHIDFRPSYTIRKAVLFTAPFVTSFLAMVRLHFHCFS